MSLLNRRVWTILSATAIAVVCVGCAADIPEKTSRSRTPTGNAVQIADNTRQDSREAAPANSQTQKILPKVAVYVTGGKNANENKALSARITHALVSSGRYSTIERSDDFLDQVAKEMVTQRSGAIDDKQISKLGQQAGANFVCVGEILEAFGAHQISARIVNVESVEVTASGLASGQLRSMADFATLSDYVVASLLGVAQSTAQKTYVAASAADYNSISTTQSPQPAPSMSLGQNAVGAGQVGQVGGATAVPAGKVEPPIQGIIVPGGSLTEKLAWLNRSADSHNTYIVEVDADESIAPHTFKYSDAIDITIVLRGVGGNRTIRLKSHGMMFTIEKNVTFILDNNITLMGHSGNTGSLVYVRAQGIFKMNNGTTITSNSSNGYGSCGGGVCVGGTFEMNGGIISGNTASEGGGVQMTGSGIFTMSGGTISNNVAIKGGGVYVFNIGDKMTIRGGNIIGNTAREYGGGVYIRHEWTVFTKTGGTITGYSSDPTNGNVVKDDGGDILARRGHAIYRDGTYRNSVRRKETTVGPGVKFSKDYSAWDE